MDLTGMTESERFFTSATELPEGKAIMKEFADKKSADSFRVALYKVRKRLEDYTVNISIDDCKVKAVKSCSTMSYTVLNENGEIEGEVVIDTAKERLEKALSEEVKEILQSAVELGWSEEMTKELISAARDRITDIAKKGVR